MSHEVFKLKLTMQDISDFQVHCVLLPLTEFAGVIIIIMIMIT